MKRITKLSRDPPDMRKEPGEGPPTVVLMGGTVWDGQAGKPAGKKEILVQDGTIAAIGTRVARPSGARVIIVTSARSIYERVLRGSREHS